jgi:excisionase family DNA binding protein
MEPTSLPELWDIDRLADFLGVGRRFVYRLTEEHRIRFLLIGGRLKFRPGDVADYLDREAKDVAPVSARRRSGRPLRSTSSPTGQR